MKKTIKKKTRQGSRVGDDLVEAFEQMAAYLRGEIELESYHAPDEELTPQRIRDIRRKVARSTSDFQRQFRIPARTMEAYEQGQIGRAHV